jgi:hypothetical protein
VAHACDLGKLGALNVGRAHVGRVWGVGVVNQPWASLRRGGGENAPIGGPDGW